MTVNASLGTTRLPTPRQQAFLSGYPIHREIVRASVAPAYERYVNSGPLDYRILLLRSGCLDNEGSAQRQKARCQFISKSLSYFSTSRRSTNEPTTVQVTHEQRLKSTTDMLRCYSTVKECLEWLKIKLRYAARLQDIDFYCIVDIVGNAMSLRHAPWLMLCEIEYILYS